MAYSNDNENLIEDLMLRKEFYWNKKWEHKPSIINDFIPRFLLEDSLRQGVQLKPHSYQRFIETFFNPNTPYKKLLLLWDTGTGKTVGSLLAAMRFINNYRLEFESGHQEIGSVFIIGFAEKVFKNDLLRFTEFGFLNKEEKIKLDQLKKTAIHGTKTEEEIYHKFLHRILKRLTNRKGNGFFKFYGYKAFVNRIFIPEPGVDLNSLSEEDIRRAIKDKKIKYDETLLAEFKNSLMICDEIHNVYNSIEKNNWGIAVQSVLDSEPTCRAIFMSATPINNSPTEIVDILNLLLPKDGRLTKEVFFKNDKELKAGALNEIANYCKGRVSFLKDSNPKYFPRLVMHGESIPGIDYLKFIRCPMSNFHYTTYKQIYTGALSQESQYLVDFALPNPESEKIGIYQTNQIKRLIHTASQKWKDKNGIDFIDGRIVGEICKIDNIQKYSTKYEQLLHNVLRVVKNKGGKICIYHNVVHMSGILFIAELLRQNGIIDENTSSNENTLCVICGKTKKQHKTARVGGKEKDVEDDKKDTEDNNAEDKDDSASYTADVFDDSASDTSSSSSSSSSSSENGKKDAKEDDEKSVLFEQDKVHDDIHEDDNYRKNIDKRIFALDEQMKKKRKVYVADEDDYENNELDDLDENIPDIKQDEDDTEDILSDEVTYKFEDFVFSSMSPDKKTSEWAIYKDARDNLLVYGDQEIQFRAFKKKKKEGNMYYLIDVGVMKTTKPTDEFKKILDTIMGMSDILIKTLNTSDELNHYLIENKFALLKQDLRYSYFIHENKENNDTVGGGANKNIKIFNTLQYIPNLPQVTGGSEENHEFRPARFILVHSDIDSHVLDQSIEKYNHPDNIWGHNCLIMVGAKKIKESIDLKAIQNLYIVSRPDNIQTFIQIRGRAVRKNSHKGLPPDNKVVNLMIFTSSLPKGSTNKKHELSYEEEKYKEKIEIFKTIQRIEKVFHENAIDGLINYDIIEATLKIKDPLGALPYEPNVEKKYNKQFSLSELNDTTFKIYYAQEEINIIKTIVKRLFIEISSVWEYKDLLEACKNPSYTHPNTDELIEYETEINTNLFEEENFIIALSQLVWNNNSNYVEPVLSSMNNMDIIDRLNDPTDKIILLPGEQNSVIVHVNAGKSNGNFYILLPLDAAINRPIIDVELPYRVIKREEQIRINMNSFIQNKKIDFDYDDKKKIFIRKWFDVSIENMENVVCEYGTNFHNKFLEECIEYVFNAWTNPKTEKSEYHSFYFKMLYYYDLLSLVMWCHTCKPSLFAEYLKYAIPVKSKDIKLKALEAYEKSKEIELEDKNKRNARRREKRDEKKRGVYQRRVVLQKNTIKNKPIFSDEDISPPDGSDLSSSGIINLLKTSINRSSNVWIHKEFRNAYNQILEQSEQLFAGRVKKNKMINKVEAKYLPIGHYIKKFPNIYHPERGWHEDPTYSQSEQLFVENDLLIGYDEKSKTGVHVRFKLRNPIHNIKKYKDIRMIEKGSICKSKNKIELKRMAERLNIVVFDKINVDELCALIRTRLIRLELKERIAKSNKKYFYFHYEARPDTVSG